MILSGMQIAREPQWRAFIPAADVLTPSSFLSKQTASLKNAPLLERDRIQCEQQERIRLGTEAMLLCRSQRALCMHLASQMKATIEVLSCLALSALNCRFLCFCCTVLGFIF